jgi:hypothetical protein
VSDAGAATVIDALADRSELERLLEFGVLELGLLHFKKIMVRDGMRAGDAFRCDHHRN